MQEGKRQKQVGALLEEELNHIFQRLGLSVLDGAMVSISSVKVTPDLLEARVYLSLFKAADKQASMKKIEERSWEIKKELVQSVRRQLRNMPQLSYFLDDTLDYVDKMENLFNQIKQGESAPGKKE
ncbi:MAG TPA: 30S ribosome-binding factor RbfA [Puia sp.]|nr:30S ribosome-binding factor RbfA [Puia sp.]